MNKSKKFMIAALLLVTVSIFTVSSTISLLSYKTDPVVNTFSGGAISIKLDEALVSTNGKKVTGENAKRVTENTYKCKPGAVLDKDPTPTVLKGSEECYVFLCVENQLTDQFAINYDTESWNTVKSQGNKTVYRYKTTVNASESEKDIVLKPIFTKVTVSNDLTSEDLSKLGEKKLSITAYAVQSDSVTVETANKSAIETFLSK